MNDRYDWDRERRIGRDRGEHRAHEDHHHGPRESRQGDWHEDGWQQRNTPRDQFRNESAAQGDRWGDRSQTSAGAGSRSYAEDRYAGSRFTGAGYGPTQQAGDYFGPGDYGSGNHAYTANWDRGTGASRHAYDDQHGSYRQGASGQGYAGAGQSWQRDTRNWGDPQQGGGYARDTYGDEPRRGWFERASDEVASWWGDDEAARRREQDHSGRGPSNYTRSDERIREDANDRLTADPRVDARNISVAVEKGEVTLSGTVAARADKHRAEECVERVPGARHVQNNLRVQDNQDRQSSWGSASASTAGTPSSASSATGSVLKKD